MEVEFDYLDMLVKRLDTIPIRKFLKDLMMDAKVKVEKVYSSQGFDGNTDFRASVRTTPMSATLTVRGADVGFLEFGAGISTNPMNEFAEQVPYPVYLGSYSDESHGMLQRTHYMFWVWTNENGAKVEYHGIEPTRGMQSALTDLRQTIKDYMRQRIASWLVNGK